MALQVRLKEGDPRFYNTNRDLAFCWPSMATEVVKLLSSGRWDHIKTYLAENGVSDEEVGKACDAYCTFMSSATKNESSPSPQSHLRLMGPQMKKAGWFDVRPEAQIAFMAMLGNVATGMAWYSVREATFGDMEHVEYRHLQTAGRRAYLALSVPRWYRGLYLRLHQWFKGARLWLSRKSRVSCT